MGSRTLTELRAGAPLRAGGVTIVPLEAWRVTVGCHDGRIYADGAKRAAGVVIVDAGGTQAFDASGDPLDLEELRERAVGLRERL